MYHSFLQVIRIKEEMKMVWSVQLITVVSDENMFHVEMMESLKQRQELFH
jgi:hypothetical protein